MSVIARLEVIPQSEPSMSEAVARAVEALDEFDVSYETTPTDTVIEAEDPTEVFAAAEAAHRAANVDRLITSLEVDEQRNRTTRGHDRVEAVERRLGRPAKRRRERRAGEQMEATTPEQRGAAEMSRPTDQPPAERPPTGEQPPAGEQPPTGEQPRATGRPQRYGGPWRSPEPGAGRTGARTPSRYLQSRRRPSR